jgi:hypothetical protein
MIADYVIDHLWQSTLVTAAIAALTLTMRRIPAQTRYWMWFAASVKFLIPFAALAALGAQFEWRHALPPTPAEWTDVIAAASQPFSAPLADRVLPRVTDAGRRPPLRDRRRHDLGPWLRRRPDGVAPAMATRVGSSQCGSADHIREDTQRVHEACRVARAAARDLRYIARAGRVRHRATRASLAARYRDPPR